MDSFYEKVLGKLTAREMRVVVVLVELGASERRVSPSLGDLAEVCEVDRSTVIRALAKLEKVEVLERVAASRRGGVVVPASYRLVGFAR